MCERDTRGRNPANAQMYDTASPSYTRHRHTPSEITSSSISSMGEIREERKQFYGMTRRRDDDTINVNGLNRYEQARQNGRNGNGHSKHQQHHAHDSYSSTNTDGEDARDVGLGEGDRSGLFNLDEGESSFTSIAQSQSDVSVMSEGSGTNQNTPVMARRIGYLRDGRSATPV